MPHEDLTQRPEVVRILNSLEDTTSQLREHNWLPGKLHTLVFASAFYRSKQLNNQAIARGGELPDYNPLDPINLKETAIYQLKKSNQSENIPPESSPLHEKFTSLYEQLGEELQEVINLTNLSLHENWGDVRKVLSQF